MKAAMFRRLVLLLSPALILLAGPALAAQEGSGWLPLERITQREAARGARAVHAVDADGKLLRKAELRYDERGLLVEERYSAPDGVFSGRTVYSYDGNRLAGESLFNAAGGLVARSVYRYESTRLAQLQRFDGAGQLQSSVAYRYDGARLIGGTEIGGGERDEFEVEYRNDLPIQLRSRAQDGTLIYELSLEYDSRQRLVRRIRQSAAGLARCDHIYDPRGRLLSLNYYQKTGEQWKLERRLEYSYPE